ncbi:MAG: ankyrin repeat domain-containing protein [Chloroflexales bacterium]|nr:ankyrin repeat domain-containing protein [Chloroflexales bacterium]
MELFTVVERGDREGVRGVLAAGADVDARDLRTGWTPLMAAAANPRAGEALLRLLLAHGADVNARSWTPETAPQAAVALTSPESREYTWNGVTPLLLAASTGDLARVRALLDAGADLAATTTHGYDALINALYSPSRAGQPLAPLVALLLARGADPQRRTVYGESALLAASGFARFDIVRQLLAAGAERDRLRWSPLMEAVVFGSLEEVRGALAAGPDLEARDSVGRTALHLSIQVGDLAKAQALRAVGATLASGFDGRSPLTFAIQPEQPALLAWLLAEGCDPEVTTSSGETPLMVAAQAGAIEAVRLLLAAGARVDRVDQFHNHALALAEDPAIVRLLLDAGADLNLVSDTMRTALFGLPPAAPLELPREAYLAGRWRRFGRANPEVMDEPFWQAMVRSRAAAYTARSSYGDTGDGEPVWCFARFGRSLVALPDGRFVEIGGEHEDFYDPDFCIYNDVVVYHGDGTFTLYGYPAEVFPPTDFHTATLVGETIYLIGSLGYQGQRRVGETPVYRLNCTTWAMARVATGGELPGWISRHTAAYEPASHRIVVQGGKRWIGSGAAEQYVDNPTTYALDLTTLEWRRLADAAAPSGSADA